MAKGDKKVISLADRRRVRTERDSAPATEDSPPGAGASLAPIPGRLIWLHCPTCHTVEYTEVQVPGGRVHNACGTRVEEITVELDLRAEYTLAQINLERLNILQEIVEGQRKRYEEYKKRVTLAAGRPPEPYPVNEETLKSLPVAEVDALGLLVSRFFLEPARLFGAEEGSEPPEPPE